MTNSHQRPAEAKNSLGLTLLERVVLSSHLPYGAAVLLLALGAGSPGYYLALYLDRVPFAVPTDPIGIAQTLLFVVVPIYPYVAVRYVRRKVLDAEPDLQTLAPDGRETYLRGFRPLEATAGPLALTVALFAVSLGALGLFDRPVERIFEFVSLFVPSFGFASMIWVYAGSLWGLYIMGRSQLRLKPYYEDALLGARVMGSLSLTLAFIYFGGLLLVGLLFFSNAVFLALLVVLCVVGIVLFFLPLGSIHRRMLEARKAHRAAIGAEFRTLLASLESDGSKSESGTLADVTRILAHDILDRKAAAISTWPFDTGVLSQFTVVIVSVIAILLARIAQVALHL